MSLATRCTACGTVFRVVQDQLKVSEGWVRCGRCSEVFNAFEGMVEIGQEVPPGPVADPSVEAPVVDDATPAPRSFPPVDVNLDVAVDVDIGDLDRAAARPGAHGSDDPGHPPSNTTTDRRMPAVRLAPRDRLEFPDARFDPHLFDHLPPGSLDPALPPEPTSAPTARPGGPTPTFPTWGAAAAPVPTFQRVEVAPGVERVATAAARDSVSGPAPTREEVPGDTVMEVGTTTGADLELPLLEAVEPHFVRHAQRQARWKTPRMRALQGVSLAVLLACLGLQAAFHFRDSLAARWPAVAPLLAAWCGAAACTLEAPRRIDDVVVESSTLTRAGSADTFRLSVVLRNRGTLPLALPSVDLSLTDANSQPLARRMLAPRDFGATATALKPGAESPLQLLLQNRGTTRVTGYTVEVFYP